MLVVRANLVLILLICIGGLLWARAGAVQRWERTYGGRDGEHGNDVQITRDGGYILAGSSRTIGVTSDALWLIRTDSLGDTVWTTSNRPAGVSASGADAVIQTDDGGYIAAGNLWYDPTAELRMYVLKTDSSGDSLWARAFGDPQAVGDGLARTRDGGCIVVGWRAVGDSISLDYNAYVVKLDSSGDSVWSRCYGGPGREEARDIQQTSDGGYIFVGFTSSHPYEDGQAYMVRLDSQGSVRCSRAYGWRSEGEAFSRVRATADGGFVAVGGTYSVGGGDWYLVRTDSLGDTLWSRTYGGDSYDYCSGLDLTPDGGFVLAGQTFSYGAGASDIWLVRLDSGGNVQWSRTFGGGDWDWPAAVHHCRDGGFIIDGTTASFGSGGGDFYLIKTDETGSSAIKEMRNRGFKSVAAAPSTDVPLLMFGAQTIKYLLPRAGRIEITFRDVSGRRCATLRSGPESAGWHELPRPSGMADGVYIVRLRTETTSVSTKLVQVR
jgi:hypothetical protein